MNSFISEVIPRSEAESRDAAPQGYSFQTALMSQEHKIASRQAQH